MLTTEMPDGRLQSTVVWLSRDGDEVLVNTMRELRQRGRAPRRTDAGYTGHPSFYGYVYDLEQRELETRVIARIHPRRVNCDAIHG